MNEPLTTYTIKGKNTPMVWELKFDLNGFLKEFKFIEGELSEAQKNWLFHPKRYPYKESMVNSWKAIKNIEIIEGLPDLTFDTFYNLYKFKVSKIQAQRAWNRLTQAEKLKAIKKIKDYEGYIQRQRIKKVYPATYLNNKRFEDNFGSIH